MIATTKIRLDITGEQLVETWARDNTLFIVNPIANIIAKLGISPNAITLVSFLLNVMAGVLIGQNQPLWGGMLMAFIAMPLDAIDGAVARIINQQTKFGAFFDSVFDRFSEAAILIGIAALFIQRHDFLSAIASYVALLGSLMVSYTRARAEGLGLDCKVGWFPKIGRVIVMATGLILNRPVIMIWVLAIASLFTTIQRIVHVYNTFQVSEVQRNQVS